MELQSTTLPLLLEPKPTLVDPSTNEKEKIRKYFPKKLMIAIQVHHRKVPDQIFSIKIFLNCT